MISRCVLEGQYFTYYENFDKTNQKPTVKKVKDASVVDIFLVNRMDREWRLFEDVK
jgi:hypothetical protein